MLRQTAPSTPERPQPEKAASITIRTTTSPHHTTFNYHHHHLSHHHHDKHDGDNNNNNSDDKYDEEGEEGGNDGDNEQGLRHRVSWASGMLFLVLFLYSTNVFYRLIMNDYDYDMTMVTMGAWDATCLEPQVYFFFFSFFSSTNIFVYT